MSIHWRAVCCWRQSGQVIHRSSTSGNISGSLGKTVGPKVRILPPIWNRREVDVLSARSGPQKVSIVQLVPDDDRLEAVQPRALADEVSVQPGVGDVSHKDGPD